MKSSTIITALFFSVTCCFTIASCSKSNNAPQSNLPATDSVTALLVSGSWTVGSLTQAKEDNTSKFKDYTLQFSAAGKLSVFKNGVETQGSWSYTPAVTYYGASSKEAMSINMGTSEPFRRLTGTWNLVSRTTVSIKMDNPEILEDEHLMLQK